MASQYDLARVAAVHTVADDLELADNVRWCNSPDALQDARREIDALKWAPGAHDL